MMYDRMNRMRICLNSRTLTEVCQECEKAEDDARTQSIQIIMNINRILNKYIISKYVKLENKPG